ncbi:hypothetical protein DYH09_09090 [bacterium CPR1]|jgi:hypothetical protein|nr:hypothetical protein [bacterium CPR1]
MEPVEPKDIQAIFDHHLDRITRAIALGSRDALIKHKALGVPIATWRDGQVVIVPPEEIVIPEIPDE